jgi:hypothetical protein
MSSRLCTTVTIDPYADAEVTYKDRFVAAEDVLATRAE